MFPHTEYLGYAILLGHKVNFYMTQLCNCSLNDKRGTSLDWSPLNATHKWPL